MRKNKGIYPKYKVVKISTGEEIGAFFVLRPLRDKAAIKAIKTYAMETENKILARDLLEWLDGYEDKRCIDPSREFCDIANSPICCCECDILNSCIETGDIKCFLAEEGLVRNIEECAEYNE